MSYQSWGRYPRVSHQGVRRIWWRADSLPVSEEHTSVLPFGRGASQGDSCLNEGGVLLDTSCLNHFIFFDGDCGLLRAEAGMTLAEVLSFIVPRGFFLPVTPGTQYVTLGGALANDVHGKNHHRAGTFGCHVTQFELLRSDGRRLLCSSERNSALYRATIGGLGLTGLVTWIELRLKPIHSEYLEVETVTMSSLDDFFRLAPESDRNFDYTVAWVDCLARGRSLGRGLFIRGNHAQRGAQRSKHSHRPSSPRITLPFDLPNWFVNRVTVKLFTTLWYYRRFLLNSHQLVRYGPFFYPLDAVGSWNRVYGARGFFQYQCVVPHERSEQAIRSILERVAASGLASFLSTMKLFGGQQSPGLLSFPRPGVTLAVDFANYGPATLALLDTLDDIVRDCKGAVYPAKDARMSSESFKMYFPRWQEFAQHIDPKFSSSFWRRVTR